MPDQPADDIEIPVLKDMVVPVTPTEAQPEKAKPASAADNTHAATLQAEVDHIIERARSDFDKTIAEALTEMQARIERELGELHIKTPGDR